MKKVYIATFNNGFGGPAKVFANDEEDARRAAYAVHTYNGPMWYPNQPISEIVIKVELDPDQIMDSVLRQPAVQVDYIGPTAKELIEKWFSNKEKTDV